LLAAPAALLALAMTSPALAKQEANRLAPLPASAKPSLSHAPFEMGECQTCHVSNKQPSPGKLKGEVNAMCLDCHNEFSEKLGKAKFKHEALDSCVNCHTPHNTTHPMLLHTPAPALCLECHDDKGDKHPSAKPAAKGTSCLACHSPHSSNKPKLAK